MNPTAEEVKRNEEISPEMRDEIMEAMNTPLGDCIDEKDILW